MAVKVKEKVKGSGEWWLFIDYNGKRKARKVGTKTAADKARVQIEARLTLGDLSCLETVEPKVTEAEPTLKGYTGQWIQAHAARCKLSTLNYYKDYQKRYVLPQFGEMKMSAITRRLIESWRGELVMKGLAANTVRLATAALRIVLTSAVQDGILQSNEALKLSKVRARKAEREPKAMEPAEVIAFLNAARKHSPEYFPMFYIGLSAGLRQGELIALRWGDLNLSETAPYIHVQRRWYRDAGFDSPKGNRARKVDIGPELRMLLSDLREQRLRAAKAQGGIPLAMIFCSLARQQNGLYRFEA